MEATSKGLVGSICRGSLLPLTLSTLMGQSSGLRKLYPIKGIIQRTVLRMRHSHICGWVRLFLATPVGRQPREKRLKSLGEGGGAGVEHTRTAILCGIQLNDERGRST